MTPSIIIKMPLRRLSDCFHHHPHLNKESNIENPLAWSLRSDKHFVGPSRHSPANKTPQKHAGMQRHHVTLERNACTQPESCITHTQSDCMDDV